jgi:hypothetical protein
MRGGPENVPAEEVAIGDALAWGPGRRRIHNVAGMQVGQLANQLGVERETLALLNGGSLRSST